MAFDLGNGGQRRRIKGTPLSRRIWVPPTSCRRLNSLLWGQSSACPPVRLWGMLTARRSLRESRGGRLIRVLAGSGWSTVGKVPHGERHGQDNQTRSRSTHHR
jgi:hypothetical protein